MSKKLKKLLVVLLSLAMILTCMPLTAFAAEDNATSPDYQHYVAMGTSITGGYGMGGSGWGVGIAGAFGDGCYPRLVKDYFGIKGSYDGALLGTRAHEFRVLLEDDFHGDDFTEGWSQAKCGNGEKHLKEISSKYKQELAKADIISIELGSNELLSYLIFEMDDYLDALEREVLGTEPDPWRQGTTQETEDEEFDYLAMTQFMRDTLEESVDEFQVNFAAIIKDIRQINNDADIYVMSTYNPIRYLMENDISDNANGNDTLKQMIFELGRSAGLSDEAIIKGMEDLTDLYVTRQNTFLRSECKYADDYTYVDVTGIDLTGSVDGTHPGVNGHAYLADHLKTAILSKFPCQHLHLLTNESAVPEAGGRGETGAVVCADCGATLRASESINASYIQGDGEVPVKYSDVSDEPVMAPGITAQSTDTVIGFTSDIHNKSGNASATRLGDWINSTKGAIGKLDYLALCGDYADSSKNDNSYWNLVNPVFDALDGSGISYVATTGNHDQSNGSFATTTNTTASKITRIGEVRAASNYKVYAFGANTELETYTDADVAALSSYLEKAGKDVPVFVIAHYPLHNISERTIKNKDKVIELLNNYPNVIFVWGHNHTYANSSENHYDKVYTGSIDSTPINFTYLSAGCMSDSEDSAGSAAVAAKGLVAIVSNDKVPQVTLAYLDEDSTILGQVVSVNIKGGTQPSTSTNYTATTSLSPNMYVVIAYGNKALGTTDNAGYSVTTSNGWRSSTSTFKGLSGKTIKFSGTNKISKESITRDMVWQLESAGTNQYRLKNLLTGEYLNATSSGGGNSGWGGGGSSESSTLKLDKTQDTWTYSGNTLTSKNASKKVLTFATKEDAGEDYEGNVNFFTAKSNGPNLAFYRIEKPEEISNPTYDDIMGPCLETQYVEVGEGTYVIIINGKAIGVENNKFVTKSISDISGVLTLGNTYKWDIEIGEKGGWTLKNVDAKKYIGAYVDIITNTEDSSIIGTIISGIGSLIGIDAQVTVVSSSLTDLPYEWNFDNGFYSTIRVKNALVSKDVNYYLVCLGDYLAVSNTVVGNLTKTYSKVSGGTHDLTIKEIGSGKVQATCSICGKSYEGDSLQSGEVVGHKHKYTSIVVAPTCEESGYTIYTCTCGDSYRESPVDALGHTYGEWTKLDDKQHQRVCSRDASHIEKQNHSWDNGIVTKEATCTEAGTKEVTCTVCGETKTETIKALGHSFKNYVSDGNATCTANGTKTATCERCDAKDTKTDRNTKLSHVWDSGVVTKEATCAATGIKTYTCTACNSTKTETIPVSTVHSYKVTKATLEKSGKVSGACSVCGKEIKTTTIYAVDTVKLSYTSTTYNGNTKAPSVTVTDTMGNKLTKGTDYTVTYASGRKNVGSYKVTVKGTGYYSFTKTLTFKIKAAGIDTAKLSWTSTTYNGKTKKPAVTVVDKNGNTLVKDTDYTVTYASGRKKVGSYKVTVKGTGNYSFTKELTFKIKAAGIESAKLSYTSYTYTGKVKSPTVTVIDKNGNTLKKDTDYTVSYASGRKNVGTYKVTVKGKGNYSFTKTLTFKINPAKATLSSAAKKSSTSITVKWKKVSNVTGYQIKYVASDGTSKTVKVKGASTVSKAVTELTKGETYKVSIRTYKTVDGTTYYSGYSTAKTVELA